MTERHEKIIKLKIFLANGLRRLKNKKFELMDFDINYNKNDIDFKVYNYYGTKILFHKKITDDIMNDNKNWESLLHEIAEKIKD